MNVSQIRELVEAAVAGLPTSELIEGQRRFDVVVRLPRQYRVNPEALRQLHREFLLAGSQVLQALTFFGTREKLNRAGYGADTERINFAAVKLAREVAWILNFSCNGWAQ